MTPRKETTDNQAPSTVKRSLHYYWQVARVQMPMFVASVLSTLGFVFFLSYGNPYIMGLIIDRVSGAPVPSNQVWNVYGIYIIALILCNVVGQFCSKMQDYTVWKLEIRANYDLATSTFDTLSNQSMSFHSNRFGGSLVSQTNKFISGYTALLENLIYAIIPIVSSAVFTIAMLAASVPTYVMILSALLVAYVVIAYRMYGHVLPLNDEAAAAQNRLSGELSDSITNILAVKTYGREQYERSIFGDANHDVLKADSKRMWASTKRGFVTSGIIVVIMVLLVIFVTGGNSWFGITAGTLVMMFNYTYSLTMQFNRIGQTFQHLNRAFGDAHDMTLILDEPTLVADEPNAPELKVENASVDFRDLDFRYAEAAEEDAVFRGLTLHIPAGQRVGLVGRSGSGKTTLTKLLLRLVDIQGGQILIDGQDISKVAQVSLRRQIAYVPQEPLLFHRTIRENIAYGRPNATDADILEAARRANATEFIEKLPDGFQTVTGERGVKLSGGQRQRIAIARAILKDAPILLLDEATSALDSESEKLIQDALLTLMEGRTSLVIAHRLSTVASLDRIVVLHDGDVVEDGTHEQLVQAGGEYSRLWERQSGAFLGGD